MAILGNVPAGCGPESIFRRAERMRESPDRVLFIAYRHAKDFIVPSSIDSKRLSQPSRIVTPIRR